MTPLLEKTDNMLASWGAQLGLSRGAATQGKSGDSPLASPSEAPVRGDKPEPEANNSMTNAVVPILEKTDEYLASWGITRNVSNAKSERESMLQVSFPGPAIHCMAYQDNVQFWLDMCRHIECQMLLLSICTVITCLQYSRLEPVFAPS